MKRLDAVCNTCHKPTATIRYKVFSTDPHPQINIVVKCSRCQEIERLLRQARAQPRPLS